MVHRFKTWLRRKLGVYSPSLLMMGDRAELEWWLAYKDKRPGAWMDATSAELVRMWLFVYEARLIAQRSGHAAQPN